MTKRIGNFLVVNWSGADLEATQGATTLHIMTMNVMTLGISALRI